MGPGGAYTAVLRFIRHIIPGERLRTAFYLNAIHRPRKILRKSQNAFYRIDHVYDVCREFADNYDGKFSILEFGVAEGYAFTKKLYATRYLGIEDRVVVHGFDTFEGLPPVDQSVDPSVVIGNEWVPGTFKGNYESLHAYCSSKYGNFRLHRGLFQDTLTADLLSEFDEWKPILIWFDCDYYASTRAVLERLLPYIPSGCVVYFDDIERNFSSRFSGEMRAVWELNQGRFGDEVELVLDSELAWDSRRVYRLVNHRSRNRFKLIRFRPRAARPLGDDSPSAR